MSNSIKKINGVETRPLTAVERLEILADIYNDTNGNADFYQRANIKGKNVETFDFSWMVKQGLTTKDLNRTGILYIQSEYGSDWFKICKVFIP